MPTDTIVAEIEKKKRLLSKSQGNPNSWSSWMKTLFVQSHSSTIQCRILLILLKSLIMSKEELSDSHSFDEQNHAMNENIGGNVADNTSEVEMVEKLQSCKTKKHVSLSV